MSTVNRTTVSRRGALKLGGIAALFAGAPFALKAEDAPAPVVVNAPDLADDARAAMDEYHEAVLAFEAAEDAFADKHGRAVFDDLYDLLEKHWIMSDRSYEMHLVDLRRHFPAFAPALDMAWEHVMEQTLSDIGRCCAGAVKA